MKFKRRDYMLTGLLTILICVAGNCRVETTDAVDIKSLGIKNPEIVKALENARNNNKPVLLIFDAVWCPYCKKLNNETLRHKEVLKTLAGYEKLHVDIDKNPDDAESFKVAPASRGGDGIPAIVIFSPQGKELARTAGFMEPKEFNQFLKENL